MPVFYADLHTHTIASDHAYSTILENASYAASIGLKCIAMTDHAAMIGDAPHKWYFGNIVTLPESLHGVRILKGAEVNLLPNGEIDLDEPTLAGLEWVIASIHRPAFGEPIDIATHTSAYMKILQNPYIDALGHSGLADYPYDIDMVVSEAARLGKLIEINDHTFDVRKSSIDNCKMIALACKRYGTGITVNSDAHFAYDIGANKSALSALAELEIPETLIINRTEKSLKEYLESRKRRISA